MYWWSHKSRLRPKRNNRKAFAFSVRACIRLVRRQEHSATERWVNATHTHFTMVSRFLRKEDSVPQPMLYKTAARSGSVEDFVVSVALSGFLRCLQTPRVQQKARKRRLGSSYLNIRQVKSFLVSPGLSYPQSVSRCHYEKFPGQYFALVAYSFARDWSLES